MSKEIELSYILTTFNKVEYLKVTLPYLIAACKEDEEIVIVDGGSTDGTKEYLDSLKAQNKIHQFISEKDFGEAHGTNKAMLLAKGELLKIITDDDVFDFTQIRACKEYLLNNLEIDILGAEGLATTVNTTPLQLIPTEHQKYVQAWKKKEGSCWFSGLSIMIRRTSIPLLGLFHTSFKMVDFEYVAKVSKLRPCLAFYTGYLYVNILNRDSNSSKFYKDLLTEKIVLTRLYHDSFKLTFNAFWDYLKFRCVTFIKYLISSKGSITDAHEDYKILYDQALSHITNLNLKTNKKVV